VSQPTADQTSESDTANSLTVKIVTILMGLAAFGLAFLIWNFPIHDQYVGTGSVKFFLFVILLQLLWNPFGAVLSAGLGLLLIWSAVMPEKKNDQTNSNPAPRRQPSRSPAQGSPAQGSLTPGSPAQGRPGRSAPSSSSSSAPNSSSSSAPNAGPRPAPVSDSTERNRKDPGAPVPSDQSKSKTAQNQSELEHQNGQPGADDSLAVNKADLTKPNAITPNAITLGKTVPAETPAQTVSAKINEPLETQTHRTLTEPERERLQKYVQHGLRMVSSMTGRNDLQLSTELGATSETNAVQIVQDIQTALEKIKARGLNPQQLENAATVIGALWGEVAMLVCGCEWRSNSAGGFELVSPPGQSMPSSTVFPLAPTGLIRGILHGENPVEQCSGLFAKILGAARIAPATPEERNSEIEIPGMSFSLN
jgi:hypothetical protein